MPRILEDVANLSRTIGPRPAGTEEEQCAALYIAEQIQSDSGLVATIDDFNCFPQPQLDKLICFGAVFVISLLAFFVPIFNLPAVLVAGVAAVLLGLEHAGKPVLSKLLQTGASQNVVAKYKPEFTDEVRPKRRRKIILVAGYDSGKASPLAYAPYTKLLPWLERASYLALVTLPLLYFIRALIIKDSVGIPAVLVNALCLIAVVVVAHPLVVALIEKQSPYNEAANFNASGVAVMMEVARRIGEGRIPASKLDTAEVHGEEAARAQDLVPEGAQIEYKTAAPELEEIQEQSPEERLAAAKAAIAAMTGRPVHGHTSHLADNLVSVHETAAPSYDQVAAHKQNEEIRQAFTGTSSRNQEQESAHSAELDTQVSSDVVPHAVLETFSDHNASGKAPTASSATSKKADTQASDGALHSFAAANEAGLASVAAAYPTSQLSPTSSGVPDWFARAQSKARRDKKSSSTAQRSKFADALDKAEQQAHAQFANTDVAQLSAESISALQASVNQNFDQIKRSSQEAQPEAPTTVGSVQTSKSEAPAATQELAVSADVEHNAQLAGSSAEQIETTNAHKAVYATSEQHTHEEEGQAYVSRETQAFEPINAVSVNIRESTQPKQAESLDQAIASVDPERTSAHGTHTNRLDCALEHEPRARSTEHNGIESALSNAQGALGTLANKFKSFERATVDTLSKSAKGFASRREEKVTHMRSEDGALTADPHQVTVAKNIEVEQLGAQEPVEDLFATRPHPALDVQEIAVEDLPSLQGNIDSCVIQNQVLELDAEDMQASATSSSVTKPAGQGTASAFEAPEFTGIDIASQNSAQDVAHDTGERTNRADHPSVLGVSEYQVKRPVVLPDVEPAQSAVVSQQQNAPLADVAEGNTKGAARSLLKQAIPDFDIAPANQPKLDATLLPSMSGTISYKSDKQNQTVSMTGSFAPLNATGSFEPVSDALVADLDPDDLYIEDVDDSSYEENMTETGAYAGPGYVEMPQSRIGRFFSKFRKKQTQGDIYESTQEWLDVDENFEARQVGAERGSWESFRADKTDTEDASLDSGVTEAFNPVDNEVNFADEAFDGHEGHIGNTGDFVPVPSEDPTLHTAPDDESDARSWHGGSYSRVQADVIDKDGKPKEHAALPEGEIEEAFKQIYKFRNPEVDTEVWFVALGAQYTDGTGMKRFLEQYRHDLRGSFIVNLEGLGAGTLSYVTKEGLVKKYESSSRIKRYLTQASKVSGHSPQPVSMLYRDSAAVQAMAQGVPAVTLAGIQDDHIAFAGAVDDVLEEVQESIIEENANFVMELIKSM